MNNCRRLSRPHRSRAIHLLWILALLLPTLSPIMSARSVAAEQADKPNIQKANVQDADTKIAKPANDKPQLMVLKKRLELRKPFNDANGKVRMIAFLSPTCSHCLNNVTQIQEEFLMENPQANVELFLVWVKALDADSQEAILEAAQLIPDSRVSHYWDEKRILNHWLLDAIMSDIKFKVYDIFLLYDTVAVWEKRLPRPGFWLHEIPRGPGPRWGIDLFKNQMNKALRDDPFDIPY